MTSDDRLVHVFFVLNTLYLQYSRLLSYPTVDIKTKPGFHPRLKNQVVDPETDVVLNCSSTGYPKPYVHWEDSKRRRLEENGHLLIKNVRKSETYRCIAKNYLGNATMSVNVTLSGLPFAPKNVRAKSKTGYFLTVSWQDGESGTRIDYHRIKYRKKGNLYWENVPEIQGSVRKYILDNLDPYADYEVQVFSRNNIGRSRGSKIVTMKTEETGE